MKRISSNEKISSRNEEMTSAKVIFSENAILGDQGLALSELAIPLFHHLVFLLSLDNKTETSVHFQLFS